MGNQHETSLLVRLGCGLSKANQQKIWIFWTEDNDAILLAVVCLDTCGFSFTIITREGLGESPYWAQFSFSETACNSCYSLPTLQMWVAEMLFSCQPAIWFRLFTSKSPILFKMMLGNAVTQAVKRSLAPNSLLQLLQLQEPGERCGPQRSSDAPPERRTGLSFCPQQLTPARGGKRRRQPWEEEAADGRDPP